jgi:hypothetical protein
MILTHKEVAFILNITQEDAIKKIILIDVPNPFLAEQVLAKTDKITVDSEVFDKRYNTSCGFAANDIANNCLKRAGYRKYLLHDWPKKLLDEPKPDNVIQLPVPLRRLVSDQDKEIIREYWEEKFRHYITIKGYSPIFEP